MSQSNILDNKSNLATSHVVEDRKPGQGASAGDCERCTKLDQQYDEQQLKIFFVVILIIRFLFEIQEYHQKLIILKEVLKLAQHKFSNITKNNIHTAILNFNLFQISRVKASERLKQNNEDLRVKIDELSSILQEKIEALKQKKAPQKKQKSVDPVKKELDVISKRIFMAQRQLKILEDKQSSNQNVQRITEMKNEITEKQMLLQKLIKENKLLEDIKIQNEAILAEREAAQEIKDLEEEAIGLRGLLKDVRKEDRQIEKEMTKQCQYLIALEQKHKEVCEKFGISPTLNQTRFDNLQDLIAENHKNRQKINEKQEKEKKKKLGDIEINAESYKKLNEDIKKKKQEKQDLDISQKKELDDIQSKIKQVSAERETILLRLRDKEKELNIAIMKINELKRLTKHNALQPLVLESIKGNRQDVGLYMKMKKEYRREQKGVSVGSETACSWDNSNELPETKDYQIQQINIWFQEEQIKGIQVEYKLRNGEKVVLDGFFPKSTENLQEKVLKLRGPEYIQSISGYYNNYFIEYLRIVSSRGNYILAGTEKNQSRCKKFEFDIKKDEKPISFFGVVDKINLKKNRESETQQDEDMVLISFGIELKKRDAMNKVDSISNRTNGNSVYQNNNQYDEDDYELYADLSKKNQPKNGQRKIIDANNSKVHSEFNDFDNNQNINITNEANENKEFRQSVENSPQANKVQNQNSPQNNQKKNPVTKQGSIHNSPQNKKKQEENSNILNNSQEKVVNQQNGGVSNQDGQQQKRKQSEHQNNNQKQENHNPQQQQQQQQNSHQENSQNNSKVQQQQPQKEDSQLHQQQNSQQQQQHQNSQDQQHLQDKQKNSQDQQHLQDQQKNPQGHSEQNEQLQQHNNS
ncbi:hypothetical protein TTHERM_00196610 (macronuclear) [Tetrahymena thermophila SB210]|uniref:Jacalin-type lectin domain-containing protein n=1 Tax=Tetrahymena thermophila (strain SB210) TaxID=312017 RepID=Q23JX3_TETTS|nr:hypothetical protein TTHERM_00196610 [Tetrahymena thermophila SB210]EAR97070.4 hypothetical protein TTHERM_00196610 [Tetrahymena thermophila SB210]|eukprot:XP_001017315.4 hypothetical protein TTHERM_00196610 [Tetrahymena thermophila SB210]